MTDSAHFKRYEFLRTVGMYPERTKPGFVPPEPPENEKYFLRSVRQAAINRRLGKHRVDHRAKALTERRAS